MVLTKIHTKVLIFLLKFGICVIFCDRKMNTKYCVYKNCGSSSSSAFPTRTTFFSFPLKDVEKCRHWAFLAGCEDINLKNKYLCENHFSTIYISKTPRRTVLLPNAVPYRHDEQTNKEDHFNDEYNSEKNTSREVIQIEQFDEGNDIIYSNIEMIRSNNDGTEVENVETLDDPIVEEEIEAENPKIEINPVKSAKIQKTYDNSIDSRLKKVEKVSNVKRPSSASGEFVSHITKRQKLHTTADSIREEKSPDELNNTIKTSKAEQSLSDDKNSQLDNTIDNPDITTFIYKGEEYIQMPKRIYLQQRAQLDADVKRFRNIVQEIKGLINTAE